MITWKRCAFEQLLSLNFYQKNIPNLGSLLVHHDFMVAVVLMAPLQWRIQGVPNGTDVFCWVDRFMLENCMKMKTNTPYRPGERGQICHCAWFPKTFGWIEIILHSLMFTTAFTNMTPLQKLSATRQTLMKCSHKILIWFITVWDDYN